METTFITIHDLTPNAHILYASDSIVDILGYSPEEVVHRSTWEFFHPEELPFAQARHGKTVELDKAAVLAYSRAANAPVIRRLFSSSPKDPRYHMLSHLSSRFGASNSPKVEEHEPRAALFLNRYTRTLTIMYATEGLADVLGITGEELRGKSFYYCIQENCLQDAVRCLENAKANDSIAYLRFWYRDPRQDDYNDSSVESSAPFEESASDGEDTKMTDVADSEHDDLPNDEAAIRAQLPPEIKKEREEGGTLSVESQSISSTDSPDGAGMVTDESNLQPPQTESRTSSGDSNPFTHEAIFDDMQHDASSASSPPDSPEVYMRRPRGPVELEAVVSCTSDGLVVCLRKARSTIPHVSPRASTAEPMYTNGLFATPWSNEPMLPRPQDRPNFNSSTGFHPSLGLAPMRAQQASKAKPVAATLNSDDYMNTIRDIAVFAWALVGINGSLADYGRGQPHGEAQPSSGLPIWKPDANNRSRGSPYSAADESQFGMDGGNDRGYRSRLDPKFNGSGRSSLDKERNGYSNGTDPNRIFGDPGLSVNGTNR